MTVPATLSLPGLDEFEAARERIRDLAMKTPLVRLQGDGMSEIWLKLENLQPIGSFKLRCAANALIRRRERGLDRVFTASAGNFAQGLAYAGRALGVPVTSYVPDTAARSKVEALERLGATIIPVSYSAWWDMMEHPKTDPSFIHPVADRDVFAGNGVIALEILEDLPATAQILVPYGGGGLATGIGAAVAAKGSTSRVIACESEAGAPLHAAFVADRPVTVAFDPTSFITGMGGPTVLARIWPLVRTVVAGSNVVSLAETADAVRLMVERNHIVAEGAGAAPVAAALRHNYDGPTVCVVSGGHLDLDHLATILSGRTP